MSGSFEFEFEVKVLGVGYGYINPSFNQNLLTLASASS